MEQFLFLPAWPPAVSPLGWIAVLLFAAILAGEFVRRFLHSSRILGYLAVGALLGPSVGGVIDAATVSQLRIFVDIAVGMLLFELGQRVDLTWLRRNPWLLVSSLFEAALTFMLVFLAMSFLGVRPITATAAAVLAIATSPAVVMTVIKDLRAQGQVTERIMLLTALNVAYAVIGMALVFGWLHVESAEPMPMMIAHPLYLIIGSLVVAAVLALVLLNVLRLFGRRPAFQFSATVALVLITVAIAGSLQISLPLTLLLLGVLVRSFDRERHFVSLRFGETAMLFIVLLFALAGARLEFAGWTAALPLAAAFVVARLVGKVLPLLLLAQASHVTMKKSALVSAGLMPMSGLALLLLHDLIGESPALASEIGATMFLAITALAFAGPVAVEFALRRAGEVAEDQR